jgi:hypothetical protein
MMNDNNNILPCLKTFFVHGDFDNAPADFDIFDEIGSDKEKKPEDDGEKDTGGKGGDRKPPTDTEAPIPPESGDPLLGEIDIGKDDDLLKLIRDTLWEIREFETELDNSLEQLENKFDKKEYQYDPE